MDPPRRFEWDEPKRLANLDKHGLDFAAASRFDFGAALIVDARASKHGAPRFKAVGELDGRLVAMIFAPLGSEAVSIISLRDPNAKEREAYERA